ncbi:B box-type domain-containing protein [Citrus sinensis]|uniref:B box-type domain-containing protein n=1 Tax=Citrus sinensis TaxID=2711 RepID=A0ACB8L5W5_CITSI|nr:B box-type domain-containing protein [Citrus sinensis]
MIHSSYIINSDNVLIVPRWLTDLLKGRFDEHCEEQGHNRKHKNLFCLECRTCICKDCDDHANHRLLKIFTYGTGRNQSCAVVKLDNTNELLDCSHIQPRVHNGAQVLFIKQRPQTSYGGNNCERDGCDATLAHHNSFCSIDCKVNHIMSVPSNYRNAKWLLNRVNLP